MSPGHPVRVCHSIIPEPLAKIFGFSDIEHGTRCVAHQVNSRAPRSLAEEVTSQPLHERPRIGEQQCLCYWHLRRSSTSKPESCELPRGDENCASQGSPPKQLLPRRDFELQQRFLLPTCKTSRRVSTFPQLLNVVSLRKQAFSGLERWPSG